MNNLLKIAMYQNSISWNNPEENLRKIDLFITNIDKDIDLFLLPETFNTGFIMDGSVIVESSKDTTLIWMKKTAAANNFTIGGSIFYREDELTRNRFFWISPDGKVDYYDKKHLYTPAGEANLCSPGKEQKLVTLKGFKIMLNTCYDLRFPVWSRNSMGYDVLINVANWPSPRATARKTLLMARAIENQAYVVGVNIVTYGKENNSYIGESMVVHPSGEIKVNAINHQGIFYATLEKSEIIRTRKEFPFYKDAGEFTINA